MARRDLSGRGTARAEDAQGTPTQSHISPSILVYEEQTIELCVALTAPGAAVERGGTTLNGVKDFRSENGLLPENGSSQGQNMALTCLFVPNLLDSGQPETRPHTVSHSPSARHSGAFRS